MIAIPSVPRIELHVPAGSEVATTGDQADPPLLIADSRDVVFPDTNPAYVIRYDGKYDSGFVTLHIRAEIGPALRPEVSDLVVAEFRVSVWATDGQSLDTVWNSYVQGTGNAVQVDATLNAFVVTPDAQRLRSWQDLPLVDDVQLSQVQRVLVDKPGPYWLVITDPVVHGEYPFPLPNDQVPYTPIELGLIAL